MHFKNYIFNPTSLSSASKDLIQVIGGKALNLLNISSLANIPPWISIKSTFFQSPSFRPENFQETKYFTDFINEVQSEAIEHLFGNFADQNSLVAVRSSANIEDGIQQSFAGIFESYLNISVADTHLFKEAILNCCKSFYSDRVQSYLSQPGHDKNKSTEIFPSIIIQKMVPADYSGIYFSADPRGSLNRKILIFAPGLGQNLVDSKTDCNEYIFSLELELLKSRTPFLELNFSHENLKLILQKFKPIEQYYDYPVDIEWAVSNDQLYILQCRPISTLANNNEQITVYDQSNIGENYPGVTLPLTFSTLAYGYKQNIKNLLIYLGVSAKNLVQLDSILSNLICDFKGRIYYNLTSWHMLMQLLPLSAKSIQKSFNEMIGTKGHLQENFFIPLPYFEKLKLFCNLLPKLIYFTITLKRQFKRYQLKFSNICKGWKNPSEINGIIEPLEIIEHLNNIEKDFYLISPTALLNDLWCMVLFSSMRYLVGEKLSNQINSCFAGLGQLESSKCSAEWINLVLECKTITDKSDFASFEKPEHFTAYFKDYHPKFYDKFLHYLQRYGSRRSGEMKLETSSYNEHPLELLKLLIQSSTLAKNDSNHNLNRENQKYSPDELRQNTLEGILDSFNGIIGFVKKTLFTKIYHHTLISLEFRELSRFDRVRFKEQVRYCFLALGKKLKSKNAIEHIEDIFFLCHEEILEYYHVPVEKIAEKSKNLLSLVHQRKSENRYNKEHYSFPRRMLIRGTPHFELENSYLYQEAAQTSEEAESKAGTLRNTKKLKGLGCSGGTVRAPVIVIDGLEQVPSLAEIKGKIIVCESTDPGWVYMMLVSAGIICERGSLLSHTAILGRELHIPTIVNVDRARKKISTGSIAIINGLTGDIEIDRQIADVSAP